MALEDDDPEIHDGAPPLIRWASSARGRVTVFIGAGISLFLLGSAYLSLSDPEDITAILVQGGEAARAGAPLTVRVSGRLVDAQRTRPVDVHGVRVNGASVDYEVDETTPRIVLFTVPEQTSGEAEFTLELGIDDIPRSVVFSLPVRRVTPTRLELGVEPPGLPKITTHHRVRVLPEAGELATNMNNRVYLRVRGPKGAPVGGAEVTVTHKSLPDGRVQDTTDPGGLIAFSLKANQPSLRLEIHVREGEHETRTDALLRPQGRRMMLRLDPPVLRTSDNLSAELQTWEEELEVVCDLIVDGVWQWSKRVSTRGHRAKVDLARLSPGLDHKLPSGVHQLQCYENAIAPGASWASVPVVVHDGEPTEALLNAVSKRGLAHPAGLVRDPIAATETARGFWQAVLREDPITATSLNNTREDDVASRQDEHGHTRTWLLVAIASVFLVVLLWVADMVIRNMVVTRERMRQYTAEALLESDAPAQVAMVMVSDLDTGGESLMRTRGILVAIVLLGTLILNVAGIIALLSLQ